MSRDIRWAPDWTRGGPDSYEELYTARDTSIDWGKVRLNVGYAGEQAPPIDEQIIPDNLVYMDDYRDDQTPWLWIIAGGFAGLLGLIYLVRR